MTKVLLTGGHGFVGSNVYEYLSRETDHTVYRFTSKEFDLTKEEATDQLFKAIEPDIVVHLAAKCGGIGANMMLPARFWAANLSMAINILDASFNYRVKKVVMLGTVCSYPRVAPLPFKEDALCTGWPEITNRPYGIAKLAIYEGCRAYREQFGLNYSFLIPTNMYGPHDVFDLEVSHVIPGMIRKFHEAAAGGKSCVKLWGDGTPTRDFLYVKDTACAISKAIETDTGPEPINLGSGHEVSMGALAEMIASVVGYHGDIEWDSSRPNGQPRRAVSYDRAKAVLGWEPKTELMRGLTETYNYYLKTFQNAPEST